MIDERCGGVERLSSDESAELSRFNHRLLVGDIKIITVTIIIIIIMRMSRMILILKDYYEDNNDDNDDNDINEDNDDNDDNDTDNDDNDDADTNLLLRQDLIMAAAAAPLHPPQRRPP